VSEAEDVARSREFLRQGVGTTTRRNRVLPAARLPSPIPARVGKAGPREEVGTYVEVDYALRVLETDNAMTFNYDMMNTPLDGNMRLYLQPRPRDTTAGDANYYASAVKLTTTDGLLKTDYQLTLQEAMIRPASGADRVAGFGAAPVTDWFADRDLIRGPTGVHALVKKPRKVDMLVDGTPETLTLKPPPYTSPAGNGLCVLDEILKLGDPWHGLIQGGTVRLPGGKTRPVARPGIGVGVVYPLIPYGVTPAATADAADVAAGRTWLNYGLLAGACLYEQSITTGAPSWVYIAPDNSTWRVLYATSTLLGVPTLTISFYPLRKLFLTSDKWGGLAQTLQVQINPPDGNYNATEISDIDSKGANCVFVKRVADAPAVTSAALLNLQGVPPNVTATYTLLISGWSNPLYSPYDTAITIDYSRVTTLSIEWLDYWEDPPTPYVQDVLQGDPPPYELGSGSPTGWAWVKEAVSGIFNLSATTVGFCFDASDNLVAVKSRGEASYNWIDDRVRDPKTFLFSQTRTTTGPCWTRIFMSIGVDYASAIEDDGATWIMVGFSGFKQDVPIYAGNAYGDPSVTSIIRKYSNRLYGMKFQDGTTHYWRPPISPDVISAYPADIVNTGVPPFATYHPITQQIVWETGFVNFV
jgi:hypothetical protein